MGVFGAIPAALGLVGAVRSSSACGAEDFLCFGGPRAPYFASAVRRRFETTGIRRFGENDPRFGRRRVIFDTSVPNRLILPSHQADQTCAGQHWGILKLPAVL